MEAFRGALVAAAKGGGLGLPALAIGDGTTGDVPGVSLGKLKLLARFLGT